MKESTRKLWDVSVIEDAARSKITGVKKATEKFPVHRTTLFRPHAQNAEPKLQTKTL
jgi:hypothetical protein